MFSLRSHHSAMANQVGDLSPFGPPGPHLSLPVDMAGKSPPSDNESSFSENDLDSILSSEKTAPCQPSSPQRPTRRMSAGMSSEMIAAVLAAEGRRRSRKDNDEEDDNRQVRRLLTNKRERWRQQMVNDGFQQLRQLIPTFPPDKKLSKHDVLRHAARYVVYLQHQLMEAVEQRQQQIDPATARSRAISIRERQDWQFASMYNHLPLTSANAASLMSAAPFGPAGVLSRGYPTPPSEVFMNSVGDPNGAAAAGRAFGLGGFPDCNVTPSIPTPVLLSGGGARESVSQAQPVSMVTTVQQPASDLSMRNGCLNATSSTSSRMDDPYRTCWSSVTDSKASPVQVNANPSAVYQQSSSSPQYPPFSQPCDLMTQMTRDGIANMAWTSS